MLVAAGFNYDLLDTSLADKVRTAADSIQERVKKTVKDIFVSCPSSGREMASLLTFQ